MSKPDWKDAPEWAMWLAQDEDGKWDFYSEKPFVCSSANRPEPYEWVPSVTDRWWSFDYEYGKYQGDKNPDWLNTLEPRP